jgi:hypothetical protein
MKSQEAKLGLELAGFKDRPWPANGSSQLLVAGR